MPAEIPIVDYICPNCKKKTNYILNADVGDFTLICHHCNYWCQLGHLTKKQIISMPPIYHVFRSKNKKC